MVRGPAAGLAAVVRELGLDTARQWTELAACAGAKTPDAFFPEREDRPDPAVLRICAGCPVQAACLRHALTAGERHGVWGGLTPSEREALLRSAIARAEGVA